jgi:hypothetical protein
MAFARVVQFDGVSAERMEALVAQVESGERPEGLPATEIIFLHDAGTESALAILFFDSEEDYARGEVVLNAMPAESVPGRRASVTKYRVAARRSA